MAAPWLQRHGAIRRAASRRPPYLTGVHEAVCSLTGIKLQILISELPDVRIACRLIVSDLRVSVVISAPLPDPLFASFASTPPSNSPNRFPNP